MAEKQLSIHQVTISPVSELPQIQRYCRNQIKSAFLSVCLELGEGVQLPPSQSPVVLLTQAPLPDTVCICDPRMLSWEALRNALRAAQTLVCIQHIALIGSIKRTSIFLKSRRNL